MAIKICSDKKFLDEELDIIKQNLCDVNNYPRKFVQNIINYNLHKRNSIVPPKVNGKDTAARKYLLTLNMLDRKENN